MSVNNDIECDSFQNTDSSTVLDCSDRMHSGILTPFLFSSLCIPCTSSEVSPFSLWEGKEQ